MKTFYKTNISISKNQKQYRITIPAPWDSRKTLTVGSVRGDTFTKTVLDKHILHSPPSHAIDVSVLEKLIKTGIKIVEIRHREKPVIWSAPLSYFMSPEKSFTVSRGNAGLQRGVYLQFFLVNGSKPNAQSKALKQPVSAQNSQAKVVQGVMF